MALSVLSKWLIAMSVTKGLTDVLCCVCSPDLPESEASYAITAGGIADAKE